MNKPLDLTLEINNKCNLRCKHCQIWKERPFYELNINEIKDIITKLKNKYSEITNISLTGGECFLNKDIEKIIVLLAKLQTNNIIKEFDLVSNGFFYDKIKDIFIRNKELITKSNFSIAFSVDGLEENHNKQRGNPKSFQELEKSIDFFITNFPNINLSVKFTATNINYKDTYNLFIWCKNKNINFAPKIVEFETNNYYHRNETSELNENTQEMIQHMKEVFQNLLNEPLVEKKGIKLHLDYLNTNKFCKNSCYTPWQSLFIDSRGKVFPCIYYNPITNIHENNWESKINNQEHKKLIAMGLKKTCKGCLAYHGFLKPYNLK